MSEIIYVATTLPHIEYDILDCASCEEGPFSFYTFRHEYMLLEDYSDADLVAALESLIAKKMLIRVYPDTNSYLVTKYGDDVIHFRSSTELRE